VRYIQCPLQMSRRDYQVAASKCRCRQAFAISVPSRCPTVVRENVVEICTVARSTCSNKLPEGRRSIAVAC